jgi:ribosomal protein S18 acetylase RimI-like enzyme
MSGVTIVTARSVDISTASQLVSRAMINLPEAAAVFRGRVEYMEAAWQITFTKMPGQLLLARDDEQIVGAMRIVEWPQCKMSQLEGIKLLPNFLFALKGASIRGMKLQSTWAKHDPQEHHWHLDPLAVQPERQKQGIGSQMMDFYCEFLDSEKASGYLETGTMDNVRFYERFGFSTVGEVMILGVPTWLMRRPEI